MTTDGIPSRPFPISTVSEGMADSSHGRLTREAGRVSDTATKQLKIEIQIKIYLSPFVLLQA